MGREALVGNNGDMRAGRGLAGFNSMDLTWGRAGMGAWVYSGAGCVAVETETAHKGVTFVFLA